MSRLPFSPIVKLAYRPGEVVKASGIARSTVYFLMNTGELPTFRIGKTTLTLHEDLVELLRQRANATKRTRKKRATGTKKARKKRGNGTKREK